MCFRSNHKSRAFARKSCTLARADIKFAVKRREYLSLNAMQSCFLVLFIEMYRTEICEGPAALNPTPLNVCAKENSLITLWNYVKADFFFFVVFGTSMTCCKTREMLEKRFSVYEVCHLSRRLFTSYPGIRTSSRPPTPPPPPGWGLKQFHVNPGIRTCCPHVPEPPFQAGWRRQEHMTCGRIPFPFFVPR